MDKVSDRDWKLLERAQQTLLGNILLNPDPAEPFQWEPLRGICPSPFNYRGVWNWDCAFHAVGAARWDPELARDQVRIFLDNQLPNGALPDVLWEKGGAVTEFGKPPVMPWACAIIDRGSPDDAFLRDAYPKFVAYEAHWRRDRGGDEHGLFHYGSPDDPTGRAARLESGWDTSPRWDKASDKLWAVDANCFMLMLCRAMAYMAGRLNLPGDRRQWEERDKTLSAKINERLWNPAVGAYMDRNFETNEFNGVLTPASFHPLYTRTASKEQAEQLAALAADPAKFYPGFPSVAYDDPAYESANYWRGPTWVNIAFFAIKGLYYYGHDKLAEDCRRTILDWCSQNEDYLYEYYDSRSGAGLGAKQYGWTAAFVIEFILNWNENDDF
jgi:putative isomerase